MKIRIIPLIAALMLINPAAYAQDTSLVKLLPGESDLEGLEIISEIDSYVGDELFFLINGGADLYLEYGFVQVIGADYANDEGSTLRIEIYEMKDRPAAFGVYSFQQLRDDTPDEIGERGQIIKNNALFIKDKYLVRMFADFPEDQAEGKLKTAAEFIASRIQVGEHTPLSLPYLLPVQDNDYPQVKFIRGSIALRNIYNFHNEDIFDFTDAVVGIYQEYMIFIFQYPGSLKAIQQFAIARSQLEKEERFSSFYSQKNQFQMVDSKGNKVHCFSIDRFNIVFVYQGSRNLTPLVDEIRYNIGFSY